jgi:diacylglycerol kinase family enzyme
MKMSGKHAYQAVFAKHLLSAPFKMHKVFIESEDCPLLDRQVSSPLILINNQPKLAGSFQVAPETKNNEGKFNVTIFLHDNRFDFIKTALEFISGGTGEGDKRIIRFETDSLKLMSLTKTAMIFFGDGETWEPSMELDIKIVPQALEVFSPMEEITGKGHSLDEVPLLT